MSQNDRPRIGGDGYLERVFAAFEADLIVESEWRQAANAHRRVRVTSNPVDTASDLRRGLHAGASSEAPPRQTDEGT